MEEDLEEGDKRSRLTLLFQGQKIVLTLPLATFRMEMMKPKRKK